MDMSLRIHPVNARGPFIREVVSNKDNTLVYDGYFYYKSDDLPLQRVMNEYSEEAVDENGTTYRALINSSHIEIYEHISGEDTSKCGEDENEDISGNAVNDDNEEDYWDKNICFFPTEITTLKYRVLKSHMNDLERKIVYSAISELEKMRDKKKIEELVGHLEDDT